MPPLGRASVSIGVCYSSAKRSIMFNTLYTCIVLTILTKYSKERRECVFFFDVRFTVYC